MNILAKLAGAPAIIVGVIWTAALFQFVSIERSHAAFDFKVGGKAINKADYLKLMKSEYMKKWCADTTGPYRVCFAFSEDECAKNYGGAFDACGVKQTAKYPEQMRFNTDKELSPVAKGIGACMNDKVIAANAGRISKEKCPAFPKFYQRP